MAPLHVFSRARDFLVSEEELPAGQRDRRRGAATFTAALKFFVPGAISLVAGSSKGVLTGNERRLSAVGEVHDASGYVRALVGKTTSLSFLGVPAIGYRGRN
jgi:hypothetical protein